MQRCESKNTLRSAADNTRNNNNNNSSIKLSFKHSHCFLVINQTHKHTHALTHTFTHAHFHIHTHTHTYTHTNILTHSLGRTQLCSRSQRRSYVHIYLILSRVSVFRIKIFYKLAFAVFIRTE